MKKIIATTLLLSVLSLNTAPVFALEDAPKSTAAPKQFKSMVKKNKKKSDDYKYEYINMAWWNQFNDDILTGYIEKAVQNNYDLKMATLAVEEYYQQTRLQFSKELPSAVVGFSPNLVKMPNTTQTGGAFVVPAVVQYEADIFLKNRDKTKAVKKLWEGSKFDERSAYISVASAVGAVYINILKLDKIIELQEEIVSDRQIIYDLMLLKNKEGIVSTADVVRANKSFLAGQTDLLELKKQRERLLHQLCVLIGESPENAPELARSSIDNFEFRGVIPTEISSEVIMGRPDYMKSEKMVEKAGLDVRVAKKEFLPSIQLNGAALFNSTEFGSIFTTKGMIAALGGMALLPLFTGGARIANLKYKKAEYERILQNYYKTNLTAIQEVNDSLVSIRMDEEKVVQTKAQAELESKEFGLNEQKYEQGVISKLDLIQFRESLLLTDKLLVVNKVECLIDYIGLYKAAGSVL